MYWLGGDLPKRIIQHGNEICDVSLQTNFNRAIFDNESFIYSGKDDMMAMVKNIDVSIMLINTTQHASFALIGFSSDEGVKRNHGTLRCS